MIDNDIIEDIKSKADIVSIISQYTDTTKKGRNYWAVCPFHQDTSPSMSVSPDKNIYKCFVCGAGGNVFTFVQEYKKISFVEAVHEVAQSIGYDMSKLGSLKVKPVDKKAEALFEMNKDAMNYFKTILKTTEGIKAKQYLDGRKIFEDEINEYNIGYASNSGLCNFLEKKGYPLQMIIAGGLAGEKEGEVYDNFRNRIIFPILDINGKVLGFSGRTLNQDSKFAKYINTKETYVFKKKEILYNINNAIQDIRKSKKLYICEGFTDVITLSRCGVKNVVAAMGTAITEEHIKIINKYADEIILIMDGDKAGIESALKSLKIINKTKLSKTVVPLPKNKDVDDVYSDHGEEALVKFLKEKEISWINFEVNYFAHVYKNDISKLAKELIERLAFIEDDVDRNLYIGLISKKTGLPRESIETRDTIKNKDIEPTQVFVIDEEVRNEKPITKKQSNSKYGIKTYEEKIIEAEHQIVDQIIKNNEAFKKYCDSKIVMDDINALIINYINQKKIDNYQDLVAVIDNTKATNKQELIERINTIKEKYHDRQYKEETIKELLNNLSKWKGEM